MNANFALTELLLRVVRPDGVYWKEDGTLSSAAFKDPNGLSVNRTGDNTLSEAVEIMKATPLIGTIVYVTVPDCYDVEAAIIYAPIEGDIYHSEIHRNQDVVPLNKRQAKRLAERARRVDDIVLMRG